MLNAIIVANSLNTPQLIYMGDFVAKYKPFSYNQGYFIPVFFRDQIQEGTFEHALNYLIDNVLDLSFFDKRYNNDETGAPAYDPRILLKVILFAYSRGITSSRAIARCCEQNIVFMALSAYSKPHFTTIAQFISSMEENAKGLFLEVLMICDDLELIGNKMFAIDGCKLPSNASKEWSGTKEDFTRKVERMEVAIERMLDKHQADDRNEINPEDLAKEKQYIEKLEKTVTKIRTWMEENDDRIGCSGNPVKSNITDNESAKMKTSKGVIQGYVGVAAADEKHQVIIDAEAYGQGYEHDLLIPTIENIRNNFSQIGRTDDIFKTVKLTADSGYHSEKNMEYIFTNRIDAYIADTQFRKRDSRFCDTEQYKNKLNDKGKKKRKGGCFKPADFIFAEDFSHCICPAGQRLYRNGGNTKIKHYVAIKFKGAKSSCEPCHLRDQCLRNPDKTVARQVSFMKGRTEQGEKSFTDRMKDKIDSAIGRTIYSKRLAIGEPPFAHIRSVMGLDRFSFRGKKKVDIQWNLFCTVHNLKKIFRFGGLGVRI